MADDTNQLRVRLVTPERTLFESDATAVELPSKSGYMEVLYGHAPLDGRAGRRRRNSAWRGKSEGDAEGEHT